MALGWRGQYARYREFFLNVFALYKRRADVRMFLEVILSLTTIIVFLIFALKPTALTIISLTNEIREKENTVTQLDKKINNLQRARNVFQQNEQDIALIQSAISSSPAPETIVRQVEGLASKNSVQVLGISVGETTLVGESKTKKPNSELSPLPEGAKEMAVSISVTGPYQNLNSMIKDIENLRIPVKVDVLGINSSSKEETRIIVAVISGRVPYTNNEK